MRFGVRVASRYEGIISEMKSASTIDNSLSLKHWRRIFIQTRHRNVVPPPEVVHVLPLTEPARPADGTIVHQPGLPAIVAEPWFQVGGFAERMQLDVAVTAQKNEQSQTANSSRIWI